MPECPPSRAITPIVCPAVGQRSAPARILPGDVALRSEAHVVRILLDGYGDGSALVGRLDVREQARAARFLNPHDRRRYIVSHAVMRTVLGLYVGMPAAALRFEAGASGKPRIVDAELEFNLSHSGERALVAITHGGPIGVDVEAIDPRAAESVSRRFLSAAEHEALMATAGALRVGAFFRCWTRKESFIKALGDGLAFPLIGFDVAIEEHVGNALLRCHVASVRADDWRVVPLAIDEEYAAAVTVTSGVARVWQWDAPDVL